jgi:hypothetical protein
MTWIVSQIDALVGQFPIEIEIEDADPLQAGKQYKKIELPNISEALAELFGLTISGTTNSDLAINFLMRLAAETIATKNAALITQDYAKANASFMGYRGNPKEREITYNFNPANLTDFSEFLKESKGKIMGWEEDDPESIVAFLQRIVFSAGIIKSVFFRDKRAMERLQKELDRITKSDSTDSDEKWREFIRFVNDPTSQFNFSDSKDYPTPELDNKPVIKNEPEVQTPKPGQSTSP